MNQKQAILIFDIPCELNDILTRYAYSITSDKTAITLDALARITQHALVYLAMKDEAYLQALRWINAWRDDRWHVSVTSGISTPSPAENILANAVLARFKCDPAIQQFKVIPCKRIRLYVHTPAQLIRLANRVRGQTTLHNFVTMALFQELDYRLSIINRLEGENMQSQEIIQGAITSREYKELSAALRELRARVTNLEVITKAPDYTQELITEVLLQLIADASKRSEIPKTLALHDTHKEAVQGNQL
jgi:hypothetical protein